MNTITLLINLTASRLELSRFIIHLFIFVGNHVLLVQRTNSGSFGPVSEAWGYSNPSLGDTAMRGAREELELKIPIKSIKKTGFCFSGISPKGDLIHGETCYTFLNPAFIPNININININIEELSDFRLIDIKNAKAMMGHQEAVEGLLSILKKSPIRLNNF